VIGLPSASSEEEMQTKITFNGGRISLGTFVHENMHQWWGDNVSESNYNMTFFKEGLAPSDPTPYTLFNGAPTYVRPGTAYIALRQILGHKNFVKALQQIQRHYGGSHITEPQLEAAFQHWLPNHTAACHARLTQFFTQWFDTAYPPGGGANRPQLTGPGLAGAGFYNSSGGCT
jgi:aminopeptidase N